MYIVFLIFEFIVLLKEIEVGWFCFMRMGFFGLKVSLFEFFVFEFWGIFFVFFFS